MVFKEIFETMKQGNLYSQALKEIRHMFDDGISMYRASSDYLFKGKKPEFDVIETDEEVNDHEMNIRRMILEHLSINPRQDTTACLILITITRDVERIADYAKNIYDLYETLGRPLSSKGLVVDLIKMNERLFSMFELTGRGFFNNDIRSANELLRMQEKTSRELKKLLESLMTKKCHDAKEIVVITLIIRYFKRTAGHLKNISRTVVKPFDKIHKGQED